MPVKSNFESIAVRLLLSLGIIFLSLHLLGGAGQNTADPETAPASAAKVEFNADDPVITLYLKDYSLLPYLKVLVNRELRGTFQSRYVTIPVQNGDSIAVDGTYYREPLSIEILTTSRAITKPHSGEIIHLNGNVAELGQVVADTH